MQIQAQNLVKIYGDRTVVNDISLTVNKSEVVGLLGDYTRTSSDELTHTYRYMYSNCELTDFAVSSDDGIIINKIFICNIYRRGINWIYFIFIKFIFFEVI